MNLTGKVLVVTGSYGALGQAVAATLSGYGAKLALLDHGNTPSTALPLGSLHCGGVDLTQEDAYAASKAGVAKLTEALAEELKDRGITVNAILPSTLDTPKNRLDMPHADFARWVTPVEAAEVIAFLVSDAARAITGALIPVAGRA